jgi:hypothetical protein
MPVPDNKQLAASRASAADGKDPLLPKRPHSRRLYRLAPRGRGFNPLKALRPEYERKPFWRANQKKTKLIMLVTSNPFQTRNRTWSRRLIRLTRNDPFPSARRSLLPALFQRHRNLTLRPKSGSLNYCTGIKWRRVFNEY